MSESFVVAEGAAVAEQPQGVDLSMDMLEAYRARLLEIQGRLHQLKEETRQTVEQLTNTLTKGVVSALGSWSLCCFSLFKPKFLIRARAVHNLVSQLVNVLRYRGGELILYLQ